MVAGANHYICIPASRRRKVKRKPCHFLLRIFTRNLISLFCSYYIGKTLAMFGYRKAETSKSYSRCLLCHELCISNAKRMKSQIWPGVHSLKASHFFHTCLQTCCFSCLKCFLSLVFSFNVQLKLNSYFFVELISPAYKCIDNPTDLTHRKKRDLRDHLVSCYSM